MTDSSNSAIHIANLDFPVFYAGVAGSLAAAREFYESLSPHSKDHQTAQLILHQVARMVWLADQIDAVAFGRPALQVMFGIIAAEAAAKLAAGYEGEKKSGEHVGLFFSEYCTAAQRERIQRALESATLHRPGLRGRHRVRPERPESPDGVADYLYK